MRVSVLGFTYSPLYPVAMGSWDSAMRGMKTLSGAAAGVCYMKDEFYETSVSDPAKALKRFVTVAGTGHHSIAGHAQVTMLLEGIPKIVAMYLNNLRDYETSEKSARYTVMSNVSKRENELYNHWRLIFMDCITEAYRAHPKLDQIPVEKLAMENARYMLSVFTPTTMVYTTSLRQWNYILGWLSNFGFMSGDGASHFELRLKTSMRELSNLLRPMLDVPDLKDTKGRSFDMLRVGSVQASMPARVGVLSETYEAESVVSFAALAQMQRHRTLKYTAVMPVAEGDYSFFIPELIRGTVFEKDWLDDLRSLASEVPQATLLKVTESGAISDFRLKAMERLCGRAQWEIMKDTVAKAQLLYARGEELSVPACAVTDSLWSENGCATKCKFVLCKEPCAFGASEALTRKV